MLVIFHDQIHTKYEPFVKGHQKIIHVLHVQFTCNVQSKIHFLSEDICDFGQQKSENNETNVLNNFDDS